jgi:uncharacterized protein YoxC
MLIPKLDNQTILLVFAAVTGLAVLLQAVFLLIIAIAVRKAIASIRQEAENLRTSITPVIYDTRDLVANAQGILADAQSFFSNAQTLVGNAQAFYTRVAPTVELAAANVAQISGALRAQTEELQLSAEELIERVHRQSERVDGLTTEFLDTVDRAGGFVAHSVGKPVQQISRVLRSVRAIVNSLRGIRA